MNPNNLDTEEIEPNGDFYADKGLLDLEQLCARISKAGSLVPPLNTALQKTSKILHERYTRNVNISEIVHGRAWVVDKILCLVWQAQNWPDGNDISLVAVGGYGRGELLPHSDIDLLILTRKGRNAKYKEAISSFLTMCWDIGLEIGQSVRSIKQCKQEAIKDITVCTALMESRILTGPEDLYRKMMEVTKGKKVWPTKDFLRAKLDEQIARHEKYHDAEYALEPNVKTSPGGLRDIQTIAWVAKRHYGASSFHDLVKLGFLKESEEAMLVRWQEFLWRLRYGLHYLEDRREDRLLFDKQKELSKLLGYEDDENNLGVEKLMKQYYRAVATLRELNDVLLQHLDEAILRADEPESINPLNNRFQIRNGYIEAIYPKVFERYPSALIEIFVLMGQNENIEGIRASTIRLIRENRQLIDDEYRKDIRNVTLFIELLRTPNHMTLHLRRMARYGILGRYLPEFGQISGQMQHDLFHIYTVDAHTLQVLENMRKFRLPEAEERFPVAARIFRNLPKVELLYIAGLYHDIAKGRGSDHSELGKVDAINFCKRHRMSNWDTKLVSWLVEKHLLMSMTAQRKDTSDPEVIHEFAMQMGDKLHLDYLYTMTVADICATNPNLWNSWRAALLRQLYLNTKRALQMGLENPINREERIADKKSTSRTELIDRGLNKEQIELVWANAAEEYFVRESALNIIWHTEAIVHFEGKGPLVSINEIQDQTAEEGATQIFIYTINADYLFANSTAAFEKLHLNIHGARIFTSANDHCMDTYTVLESTGKPVGNNPRRIEEIRQVLTEYIARGNQIIAPVRYRRTRKEKYFIKPIEITFLNSPGKSYSTLEINCPDQPGILACVGKVLAENDINLQDARITTLGERVEDLFFITDGNGAAIEQDELEKKLRSDIETELKVRLNS